MAIFTINDFFPVTDVDKDDLIHMGRLTNADPNKDVKITGSDFYNAMNQVIGMFGIPTVPASLTTTPQIVTGYGGGTIGTGADAGTGVITISVDGIYRIGCEINIDMNDDAHENFLSIFISQPIR